MLLLAFAVVAYASKRAALEDVYRDGYHELEWGNLEAAKTLAEEGLRMAGGEGRTPREWAFEVLEAEVLVAQRRIGEALDRLEIGLAEEWPVDIVQARALMTRGFATCLSAAGEKAHLRADADLAEAASIAASMDAGKVAAEVMLREGTCQIVRNDLDSAEIIFRKVLTQARDEGLPLLHAYAAGSLGNMRVRERRYDDAVQWLRRSLDLVFDLPADGLRIKTLGNLGWCYFLLGDYERAGQALAEADSLARKRGYAGDRIPILFNLGRASYGQGDYADAYANYSQASAIAQKIRSRDEATVLAEIQATRATLAIEQGHLDEAASDADKALQLYAEHGNESDRLRTLLVMGEVYARRGEWPRATVLYEEVIGSAHAEPELRWEARAALARLHVQTGRSVDAEAEFQRAFELMEASLAQLVETEHQLPFFSSLRRFYNDYVDFLVTQGRFLEALEVADRSRARLLQERLGDTAAEADSGTNYPRLARDLNAVLLFYWTARDRSFLWGVHADGVELVNIPDEGALQRLVTQYQERILQSRDPIGEGGVEGAELYEILVRPASSALSAARRVVVVPDGPLHQLNFETLVVPDPQPHYLIEDTTLVRAPSLQLLAAESAPERAEAPTLLALGDPISPSDEFPPLPFAGREIASIAQLFSPENRRVYARAQAESSAYRRADPGRFTYIHFAAHAQANPVVPLDSAVVLSARNEDYKLYARELVDIPLDADLVTLSACRSAGGRTFAGEGLVGLSWAFLSAGARHVIGGLWQVEDASTAELMEHLYRELVAGAEPPVALRRAKLELLHSGTAYRKQYYWAPFVTYASRSTERSR